MHLPPPKLLELIQASAAREHAQFKKQEGHSNKPELNGESLVASGCALTWKEARYNEILEARFDAPSNLLDEDQITTQRGEPRKVRPGGLLHMFNKMRLSSFHQSSNRSTRRESNTLSNTYDNYLSEEKDLEAGDDEMTPSEVEMHDLYPKGAENNAWAWVAKHDELIPALKEGAVFSGFIEAPITFPPSFKWKANGYAGDFTDLSVLAGEISKQRSNFRKTS